MDGKIGNRIRTARNQTGMTQEKLAEQMNLSVSAISRLENGKTMLSIENLIKLADILDIGIQDLLCDFFVYKSEDNSIYNELVSQISTMSFSERKHLLQYIHLMKSSHLE